MSLSRRKLKEIREKTRRFFERMGFEVEVSSPVQEEETVSVDVKAGEPRVLIGKRGETLRAIQRLLRVMLLKGTKEHFYLQIDINDYKKKKEEYLQEVAQEVADEVSLSQKEKPLPPMCAYERRIVHLELSERADVTTESEGEEPRRRVVVKPV